MGMGWDGALVAGLDVSCGVVGLEGFAFCFLLLVFFLYFNCVLGAAFLAFGAALFAFGPAFLAFGPAFLAFGPAFLALGAFFPFHDTPSPYCSCVACERASERA